MSKNQNIPHPEPTEPNDEPNILSSGMGSPPVSHGKKIEPVLPDDDLDVERLAEQSLEDADSDLREQAQKAEKKDDQ